MYTDVNVHVRGTSFSTCLCILVSASSVDMAADRQVLLALGSSVDYHPPCFLRGFFYGLLVCGLHISCGFALWQAVPVLFPVFDAPAVVSLLLMRCICQEALRRLARLPWPHRSKKSWSEGGSTFAVCSMQAAITRSGMCHRHAPHVHQGVSMREQIKIRSEAVRIPTQVLPIMQAAVCPAGLH